MRLLVVLLLGCVAASFGGVRYISSSSGSDRNKGTQALPYQTLWAASGGKWTPSAGDTIYLKRGDSWLEQLQPPTSGRLGARVVYAAFGDGAKPVIDAGGPLPGWRTPENWKNQGNDVWSIALDHWPGRLWLSGREYGCSGTTNQGSRTPTSRYRWWHDGNSTLYLYSHGNPASIYTDMQMAERSGGTVAMSFSNKSYLTFKNLEFRRGENCVEAGGSSFLIFDSCNVLGGTSAYGLFLVNGSDYGYAVGCLFDREDTVKHSFEYGGGATQGGGNDNVALQCASYWEFDHCRLGGCGHGGFEISGENNNGNIWESNYNWIHDCELWGGGDYDRAFLLNAIDDPAHCSYNLIERCYVYGMTTVSQITGLENRISNCIFCNQGYIPFSNAQASWRSAMLEVSDYLMPPATHIMIWNNTFVNADVSCLVIRGGQSSNPTRISIKNNIIYNGGRKKNPYARHIGLSLWQGISGDTIQNNIIYSPSSSTPIILNQQEWGGGNTWRTVAELNAFNGRNGNVISGNMQVDPRLETDFTIPSNSPAKDAGLNVGLISDYFGNHVPFGRAADIGAAEYSGGAAQSRSLKTGSGRRPDSVK